MLGRAAALRGEVLGLTEAKFIIIDQKEVDLQVQALGPLFNIARLGL